MNRKQRRAEQKNAPKKHSWHGMTKFQKMEQLFKNGITTDDLEKNYKLGYEDGFSAASEPVVTTLYAAVCLALNETNGFGKKRCYEVLKSIDQHVLNTLTSMDAVDDVYKRMKLKIDFAEPFDRIEMEG